MTSARIYHRFIEQLPNNLALYIGNNQFVVRLRFIDTQYVFTDTSDRDWHKSNAITLNGKTCWQNPWHLVASFRKHHGVEIDRPALECIFVAEGTYRDVSLFTLFQTLRPEELHLINKDYPEQPERIDQLQPGLELYVQDPGRAQMSNVRFNGSGFTYPILPSWIDARHLIAYYRKVNVDTVTEPLRHIYVAKGRDKGISLAKLLLSRSDAQLRVAGHPLPDLDAKIVAAEAELASLAALRARVETLRQLEAQLVEARKILECPELNE